MKLNEQFAMRNICGDYLLVPLGDKTKEFNGVFTLSATGAFIIQQLAMQKTIAEIADSMASEFDIDYDSAYADTISFTENLRQYGILTE